MDNFNDHIAAISAALDAKDEKIRGLEESLLKAGLIVNGLDKRIAQLEADLKTANATIAQLQRDFGVPV